MADESQLGQIQAVLTALLKHHLDESLEHVDSALSRWRSGELGPFETHAEVLKHAARAERSATQVAQVDPEDAGTVLRDAFDVGLISREEFIQMVGESPENVEPSPPFDDDTVVTPPKREFVEDLMARGAVLLHVDARGDNAVVPGHLGGDPKLVLRFGFGLVPAIVDLELDEKGISGTLTFSGAPFHCMLPWTAVYAAVSEVDQQAMVWPDDVPAAVLESLQEGAGEMIPRTVTAPPRVGAPTPIKKRPSHLKLVE